MPLYDYSCSACNHRFEQHYKIAERLTPVDLPCPSCQATGTIQLEISSQPMIDPYKLGRIQPRDDFKYRMNQIAKKHPKSKLPTY
jgi:putative FmdB family regulatory protein